MITAWLAVTLIFFSLRLLPGDVIIAQLAQAGMGEEAIQQRRQELGLDRPLLTQYAKFISGIFRGDLGYSLDRHEPVQSILIQTYPATLELAGWSLLFAVSLGILLGAAAGLTDHWIASLAGAIVNLSFAVPVYWTATLALFLVAARLGGVQDGLVLPVVVLGFHTSGAIARILQVQVEEATRLDHVHFARAKGLPESLVIWRHILRIGLAPTLSVIALQTGFLLSGTVLTETIFLRRGVGSLLRDAVIEQDYPLVQGIALVIVLVYIFVNTAADLMTGLLDPRIARS